MMNELEKKRRQLATAEMVAMNSGLNIRVRGLKDEIEILLDKENQMCCNVLKLYG